MSRIGKRIPDPAPLTHAESHPATSRRVLVVDDEAIVLVALRDLLQQDGHDVLTCREIPQAMDFIRKHEFAVVVADQIMPEMTGLDFLQQVQTIQPDCSRILITGGAELSIVIEAINRGGIYRFMLKPWLPEEMRATIRNGIQRYQLTRRNAALQAATQAMNARLRKVNAALETQVARVAEQNEQLGQLNHALERNLQNSVELCLKTMTAFCSSLGKQARRVAAICEAIATNAQLPLEQRQPLEVAARLHDIGLVGVPRELIRAWQREPEFLDETQQMLIHQHPIIGQELAEFAYHLKPVGEAIRAHHENFDGTGYPDKLAGDAIPWLGRLLAVAVGFAEKELIGRDGLAYVQAGAGALFDPEAVRLLQRSLAQTMLPRNEREVLLSELRPGMTLATGIYNVKGLLILPGGQTLTQAWIEKINAHNRMTPIVQTLQVYL
jgi:response regulator RpfG family c-di-GMP phosphodiesterase